MSNVTQQDIDAVLRMMAMDKARELAEEREENARTGYAEGQEDYSISNSNVNSAITAVVEGLAQSSNQVTREYGIKLANHLSDNYGSINAISNDSSLVAEILEQAAYYTDPNDSYLVSTIDALHSTAQDMGTTDAQHEANWEADKSFNNEPEEGRYSRRTSQADGKTYVVSNSNPKEFYTEEEWASAPANAVTPDSLGWDGDASESMPLVDK